jgi:hypothetical protein
VLLPTNLRCTFHGVAQHIQRMHICAQHMSAHNPIPSVAVWAEAAKSRMVGWTAARGLFGWICLFSEVGWVTWCLPGKHSVGNVIPSNGFGFCSFLSCFYQLHVPSHLDQLHQRACWAKCGWLPAWQVGAFGSCVLSLHQHFVQYPVWHHFPVGYRATSAQGKILCPYYLLVVLCGITCE